MDDTTTAVANDDFFEGVPSSPKDLYAILLFLLALYLVGDLLCSKLLKIVPSLVGYILVGIAFGPQGLGVLRGSTASTLVVLGNLGLTLLMAQAGLEMDYATLQLVGMRGVVIAVLGTLLPIGIGTSIAWLFVSDVKSALAAGASFGPTSAGIAMNVLGQCQVLDAKTNNSSSNNNTNSNSNNNHNNNSDNNSVLHLPVGQLIVAAAIVDDILALVVLSQLQALTTDNNKAADIVVPIVSAMVWLFGGGAIALWVFPKAWIRMSKSFPRSSNNNCEESSVSLVAFLGLLYALLVGTYYSQASYLLGAFLSGLAFCRDSSGVDQLFRERFQTPMDYLMKVFFGASIGFQVPVRSFGDLQVIGRGCFFALALLGKLAVGLLAPNFYNHNANNNNANNNNANVGRFRGRHLRDCFVVGFSMMGEAEFAFVVALFGVSEGLVPPTVYASIVWAILLSTVVSPLLLKSTLAFFPYRLASDQESNRSIEMET